MKSLKKERVSIMVADAIKEIIVTENLKSGDRLYSENQLSKKLEVSRSSIREAVRMLEVTGLVKVYQGKGVFISEPSEVGLPMKRWVIDNIELLREHFEIRLLLEPHAASVAADRATVQDVEALRNGYQMFCDYVHQGEVLKAIAGDSEFHLKIAAITKNKTLHVLMRTMAKSLNESWIVSLYTPGRLECTVIEHGKVLQAVSEHQADRAAEEMRKHLNNAVKDIKEYIGE